MKSNVRQGQLSWQTRSGEPASLASRFLKPGLKIILWLVGLAGLAVSVEWAGLLDILRQFSAGGWILVPLAVLHVIPITLDAAAWQTLTPPKRPSLAVFAVTRWVREGVNALLPAAQIGGEVVAVRILSRLGETAAKAGAVVSIDLATEFLSMVIVGAVGAVALYESTPAAASGQATLVAWALAPPTALAIIVLFLQRISLLGRLAGWVGSRWPRVAEPLARAQDTLATAWSRPRHMVLAVGLHSMGWMAGAGETWAVLYAIGHRIAPAQAFALETTTEVLRSFGFAIPGMLGLQEGSLILVGGLLGVPPAAAVALSLFRRARDIGLGLPALAAWQIAEYTRYGDYSRADSGDHSRAAPVAGPPETTDSPNSDPASAAGFIVQPVRE